MGSGCTFQPLPDRQLLAVCWARRYNAPMRTPFVAALLIVCSAVYAQMPGPSSSPGNRTDQKAEAGRAQNPTDRRQIPVPPPAIPREIGLPAADDQTPSQQGGGAGLAESVFSWNLEQLDSGRDHFGYGYRCLQNLGRY